MKTLVRIVGTLLLPALLSGCFEGISNQANQAVTKKGEVSSKEAIAIAKSPGSAFSLSAPATGNSVSSSSKEITSTQLAPQTGKVLVKEDVIKVYVDVVNHDADIFVEINGEKRNLTNSYSKDFAPSLSYDKKRVAFNSDRNDEFAVYVVNIDGTNLKKIGNIDKFHLTYSPSWSPDSRSVRYNVSVPERKGLVGGEFDTIREGYLIRYEVDVETGKEFVDRSGLLKVLEKELNVLKEKIQKDSSNKNNENAQIERLEVQIESIKKDPKKVIEVYSSCVNYGKENQNYDIYVNSLGSGGNETRKLVSDLSDDILPLLSPDKNRVIFNSDRDGKFAMYVINVDGTDLRKIYEFENKEEYDKDYRRWKDDESIITESLDKTKRTLKIN